MKFKLTLFTCVFLVICSNAQTLSWANSISSTSTITPVSIRTDSANNVYILSSANGTFDADPGSGTITDSSIGTMFVEKTDMNGNYIWHFRLGATMTILTPICMQFTDALHFIVMGNFYGRIDMDPGPDSAFIDGSGIYMAKYDSSGAFLWAKALQGTSFNVPLMNTYFHIDKQENIFIGASGGLASDLDPDTNAIVVLSTSTTFFAKYDSSGNFLWVKELYGSVFISNIKTDHAGNIYVSGFFRGTMDIDPGVDTVTLSSAGVNGFDDIFLAKYTSNGDYINAFKIGGTSLDDANLFELDDSANVYMSGDFTSGSGLTVDFDPGPGSHILAGNFYDVFIAKYDSSFHFKWVRQIGGTDNQVFESMRRQSNGDIYVIGEYKGPSDFDPGPANTNTQSNSNSNDIFVGVYDNNGNYLSHFKLGSPSSNEYIYDIELIYPYGFYIIGNYKDTLDCDPDTSVFNVLPATSYNMMFNRYDWTILSSENLHKQSNISYYPNPVSTILNLNLPESQNEIEIQITDLSGKIILQRSINHYSSYIDVSTLNAGMYFFALKMAGKMETGKFIKMN